MTLKAWLPRRHWCRRMGYPRATNLFVVRTKNALFSLMLRAHHNTLYVSLCWNAGGGPLPRRVGGFPVTTNIE